MPSVQKHCPTFENIVLHPAHDYLLIFHWFTGLAKAHFDIINSFDVDEGVPFGVNDDAGAAAELPSSKR